ncbi:hypothetical protein SERLA73DRAFT_69273 [Serpula lacrymans var. lacrymans S7.3]|uniref:Uncharacterized protein n=1 Tax=Serpula lacrymans var. lacrymans (strain S7.3) TaxID=936435 RepID=F8PIM9_SERL3|nr:hypothetical protein SERLA73DRAFT_69273 [Serpula lacrymans var. lacrymans S7.3]
MEWRGDLDRNGGLAILMFDTQAVLDGVLGRSKRGPEKEAGKRKIPEVTTLTSLLDGEGLDPSDATKRLQLEVTRHAEIALQASVLLQYLHLAQIGVSTILVKGALEMQPYNLVERTIELKAII